MLREILLLIAFTTLILAQTPIQNATYSTGCFPFTFDGQQASVNSSYTFSGSAVTITITNFVGTGCSPDVLISTIVVAGGFVRSAPGTGFALNPQTGVDAVSNFTVAIVTETLTPTATGAAVLPGVCTGLNFTAGTAVDLLATPCDNLGFVGCPDQFDIIQVGTGLIYVGTNTNGAAFTACTPATTNNLINTLPYILGGPVAPTTTAAPTTTTAAAVPTTTAAAVPTTTAAAVPTTTAAHVTTTAAAVPTTTAASGATTTATPTTHAPTSAPTNSPSGAAQIAASFFYTFLALFLLSLA